MKINLNFYYPPQFSVLQLGLVRCKLAAFIFALGPLTSALVNRLGCRLTAIIGGLSCVSGLLLSSLASSVYIMYVTYSILFGFGGSFLYLSSYVITSQYFDKNHSMATGITSIREWTGCPFCCTSTTILARLFWLERDVLHNCWDHFSCLCSLFDIWSHGEELEMPHEQCEQVLEDRKRWFDLSVFKEKVFVVLTLSNTVASTGHNIHTPRLHLVRLCTNSILVFLLLRGTRSLIIDAIRL